MNNSISQIDNLAAFKAVEFPEFTEIAKQDLSVIQECSRILSEMMEQFDNRKPDPHLPRWCWECWQCYSIGGGSLSFSHRPQQEDAAPRILVRLGFVDMFPSNFEDQNVFRFLCGQRDRSESLVNAYCQLIETVASRSRDVDSE